VHVLTDKQMANRLFKRFSGSGFYKRIEIQHFDIKAKAFYVVGML